MAAILVERQAGWWRIVLNAPERLNAFTEAMHAELAGALDEAAASDGCRAIVLTGAGRGFCAGQDLNERLDDAQRSPDLGATIERLYSPLIRRLRGIDKPVVCAVNGIAAGAGANVALACDIVLAARSAQFVQAFVRLGLVPDAGGTWVLPRLIGAARARALAMTGEPVDAHTAAAWGMIWRCVEDDALAGEAAALAARLAAAPGRGLALMKRAFAASATNGLEAQLDLERDLQRQAGLDPAYAAGVRAFLARRR